MLKRKKNLLKGVLIANSETTKTNGHCPRSKEIIIYWPIPTLNLKYKIIKQIIIIKFGKSFENVSICLTDDCR